MSKKTYAGVCPITYTQHADEITITIRGAAFDNLRKIADAMNGVGWCDDDNTPETVLDCFVVGDFLDNLADAPDIYEVTGDIVSGIDTGCDDNTLEDKKRKDELRAAFDAAGV